MHRFLPFSFLAAFLSLFGIVWIVIDVDPTNASWYIFVLLIFLIFAFLLNFLGLFLYFLRTRFYKRYSTNWYVKTSFKMAFFVATFVAILATLAVLQMITLLTLTASILVVGLLAVWSYLGKKN